MKTPHRKLILPTLFMLFTGSLLNAQNFENGFDFNLPYDDSVSVEYLPVFPSSPITEAGRVSSDDHGNFIVNGKAYRFYGGNLTTEAAFPSKEDAARVAGRMRKFGINLVRFHHIDNPWSSGSLFHDVEGTREFNEILLDRLDYFIYQLKEHGIYVNMNLNVSRTFEEVDGVIDADSLRSYGKGITQIDPHLISLQKEYAAMLLGHINPYTGMSLASDPVLAMLEIINENSLFRMWYSSDLKPISSGGDLPFYYYQQLDNLWYNFLEEKYDSTANLEEAWNKDVFLGDTMVYDGFENGIGSNWKMELLETADASMEVSSDAASGDAAALVTVKTNSSETWHLKFKHAGGSIKKDSVYELTFKAKADASKEINVSFQRDNSPWDYYHGEAFEVDTSWQEFSTSFKAPQDNIGYLRIGFTFQNNLGDFYFDDVLLKSESNSGLLEDESIEERKVRRLEAVDFYSFTDARVMDLTRFFSGLQINFLEDMSAFMTDSLGVTAPMCGTNWYVGPEDVYVQNTLDYIDNHNYWDHPQFPGESWSPTNWNIKNTPMLTSPTGTIENLFSGLIVHGKPYTVSEYNHSFPNQYQAEMLPLITSYLSSNDADGLMIFTYSGSWDWDANRVDGFFDIHRNSSLMGSLPLFSYAFRNKLIKPQEEVLHLKYSEDDINRMPRTIENWWSAHFPYSRTLGYNNRIEISFDHEEDQDLSILPAPQNSPYALCEDQVHWDKKGLLTISTPKFASITGYLDQNPGASTDMMQLESGSDFGSVSWLSLVDSTLETSTRSVLAIATKMNNTGMLWDGTTRVHSSWGREPALVYPLQLELLLKTSRSHLRVTPLDRFGHVVPGASDTIAADTLTGYVRLILDQSEDQTLWYGIESIYHQEPEVPEDTTTGLNSVTDPAILNCFPNPARERIHFEYKGGSNINAALGIYDLTGKLLLSEKIEKNLSINTSKMPPGTYYYRLRDSKVLLNGKFMLVD